MEGGIICTCDERTLAQLGASRDNFDNFYCEACGAFAHIHYTDDMEGIYQKVCAPCSVVRPGASE